MTTYGDRLTIFVSSTFKDLKDYRDVVVSAIQGLRYHADDMIDWPADERSPTRLSLDNVAKSDVIILILAHRYGTVPKGETRCITEMEFDTAVASRKPVLAFFLDEDHPWPPSRIEWSQRKRIDAFKKKVADICTVKSFTTPDNLARQVTQALAGFDRERRTEEIRSFTANVKVNSASVLNDVSDCLVALGNAEDGLPMALQILRSDNLTLPLSELSNILPDLDKKSHSRQLNSRINGIVRGAEKASKNRGIRSIMLPTGDEVKCYITRLKICDLFSDTILTSLLPSPLTGGDPQTEKLLSQDWKVISSPTAHNRFLAISLQDDRKFVVESNSHDGKTSTFVRDFLHESLSSIAEADYQVCTADRVLSTGKLDAFVPGLKRDFELLGDLSGRANVRVTFRVSRLDVAKLILQIVRAIEGYARRRVIHGDVKPQNCLVTAEGVRLIDPLETPFGTVSTALTSAWAAPEQIAMQPVTGGTDLYPVGLLLASLFSAPLVGEVVRYHTVLADKTSRIISTLRDPRVLLVDESNGLPAKGTQAWSAFIAKCLYLDPKQRYDEAAACAADLESLAEQFPPTGSLALHLDRGELQLVQLPNGTEGLCRILRDASYAKVAQVECPNPNCRSPNRTKARYCHACGALISIWGH